MTRRRRRRWSRCTSGGCRAGASARALLRMALDPRRLRALPGVRFGKLLGTGTGTGFGPGDADLTRYAAVVAWDDATGGDLGPGRRGLGPDRDGQRPGST